ncbi:PQQ-dependent sugar dehydrogenase [Desulfopila inferna]|uniref:PQQ-dependent sugar dehydrogenase n=1 Tax=Desulfopila inferna TaxID=468528 RepID=UPI0019633C6C|nr:sorbosone dehydrogenase family protein [Desulfopila inferna]MBM9603851.1 sorbosone dehydrogenase family protein [Desulfopila inferna]
MSRLPGLLWLGLMLTLAGCNHTAQLPVSAGTGPDPVLPSPPDNIIPTVNIAPAKGWPEGGQPVSAPGTTVRPFADSLDHPRWIYVLPNGDVLVAEANAPEEAGKEGIKGWLMKMMKKIAGAGVPSADRITLLRDKDGDGVVDVRTIFLQKLHSPFGMALIGDTFFVANTDALLSFPYTPDTTQIKAPGTKILDLPAGTINRHWTRNILAAGDDRTLYVTVGSNSDHGENGMERERGRAAIWVVDTETGDHRLFATGLRNPNGMAIEPLSGVLWTSVNERDQLGSDLVPDYMTSVRDGGFYGWPYSYFGQHIDTRVQPQRPDLVNRAIIPDYALGPHTSSLGLVHSEGVRLPEPFTEGMFVGQHGSWNRKPHSGYKVIFVPFHEGRPDGLPIDLLTGFLSGDGDALGRPVGVAIDKQGALLVADDVGNIIWRVTADQ